MNQQGVMTTLLNAPQSRYYSTTTNTRAFHGQHKQTCFNFLFDPKKNQTGRSFSFLISCVHSTPTIVAFFTHTQTKMLYNIYIFSSSAMLRDELLFFYFIITTAASHIVTIHLYCFIISSCCGRETS
jgi:hypothetical protein